MVWQLWLAARGPLPNRLHSSWPTYSGGEPMIILCALTPGYEWRWYSHESEVAS